MLKLSALLLGGMLLLSDIETEEEEQYIEITKTDTTAEIVVLDDIYELNTEYNTQPEISVDISSFMENTVCIINEDKWGPYLLLGMDGYPDYECRSIVGSVERPFFLTHIFTDKEISLTASKEELEEYLEETSKISNDIRDKEKYVQKTFSNDQYGGVFYNKNSQKVCVYVKDESIREELEKEGIICMDAEYSLGDLYKTLREIWDTRKEWGINYIEVNPCINKLVLYTGDREGILRRLEKAGISCAEVKQAVVLHPGDTDRAMDLGNLKTDEPDVVYYIYKSETDISDLELKAGLKRLKEEYPDYECRNLLIRIVSDGNYSRYLDFDEELLEFADSLPVYLPNEENPVEELLFGDPQKIELKSLLREYRALYPELSYKEIFEKYLSDWEDRTEETRDKKLYDLAVSRQKGELSKAANQIIEEKENKEENIDNKKNINNKAVIICYIIFVAGACGSIYFFRKKKHK